MQPTSCGRHELVRTRRDFLRRSGLGFGALALGDLLARDEARGAAPSGLLAARPPHTPAQAQSVIFMFMQGGPSQVDTFDPKPVLSRLDGQALPGSFHGQVLDLQFIKASESKLMGSRRKFRKHGQSGLEISDLFENLARSADDLAIIRSCHHESFIHGPALSLISTGSVRIGSPSVGAWVLYGLGCETEDLPAYVVMADGPMRSSKSLVGSGYLPAAYQGTLVSTEGDPLANLAPPPQVSRSRQRVILDQVRQWNRQHLEDRRDDSGLEARIHNYELAFRMQASAPELIDLAGESAAVRALYGLDEPATAKYGRMCLLARRMVERGVRFVQLYNSDWDGHGDCDGNHVANARKIDRPIAGLIADLKQRGLLESTLIVSVGEFGRTPVMQGNNGRDHNPYGFSAWMAGGGIRGGKVIGATDEIGFAAVEDKVHVNDLHATVLGLLGLDHKKLTYLFQGRDQRLTEVGGENNLAGRLLRA